MTIDEFVRTFYYSSRSPALLYIGLITWNRRQRLVAATYVLLSVLQAGRGMLLRHYYAPIPILLQQHGDHYRADVAVTWRATVLMMDALRSRVSGCHSARWINEDRFLPGVVGRADSGAHSGVQAVLEQFFPATEYWYSALIVAVPGAIAKAIEVWARQQGRLPTMTNREVTRLATSEPAILYEYTPAPAASKMRRCLWADNTSPRGPGPARVSSWRPRAGRLTAARPREIPWIQLLIGNRWSTSIYPTTK